MEAASGSDDAPVEDVIAKRKAQLEAAGLPAEEWPDTTPSDPL